MNSNCPVSFYRQEPSFQHNLYTSSSSTSLPVSQKPTPPKISNTLPLKERILSFFQINRVDWNQRRPYLPACDSSWIHSLIKESQLGKILQTIASFTPYEAALKGDSLLYYLGITGYFHTAFKKIGLELPCTTSDFQQIFSNSSPIECVVTINHPSVFSELQKKLQETYPLSGKEIKVFITTSLRTPVVLHIVTPDTPQKKSNVEIPLFGKICAPLFRERNQWKALAYQITDSIETKGWISMLDSITKGNLPLCEQDEINLYQPYLMQARPGDSIANDLIQQDTSNPNALVALALQLLMLPTFSDQTCHDCLEEIYLHLSNDFPSDPILKEILISTVEKEIPFSWIRDLIHISTFITVHTDKNANLVPYRGDQGTRISFQDCDRSLLIPSNPAIALHRLHKQTEEVKDLSVLYPLYEQLFFSSPVCTKTPLAGLTKDRGFHFILEKLSSHPSKLMTHMSQTLTAILQNYENKKTCVSNLLQTLSVTLTLPFSASTQTQFLNNIRTTWKGSPPTLLLKLLETVSATDASDQSIRTVLVEETLKETDDNVLPDAFRLWKTSSHDPQQGGFLLNRLIRANQLNSAILVLKTLRSGGNFPLIRHIRCIAKMYVSLKENASSAEKAVMTTELAMQLLNSLQQSLSVDPLNDVRFSKLIEKFIRALQETHSNSSAADLLMESVRCGLIDPDIVKLKPLSLSIAEKLLNSQTDTPSFTGKFFQFLVESNLWGKNKRRVNFVITLLNQLIEKNTSEGRNLASLCFSVLEETCPNHPKLLSIQSTFIDQLLNESIYSHFDTKWKGVKNEITTHHTLSHAHLYKLLNQLKENPSAQSSEIALQILTDPEALKVLVAVPSFFCKHCLFWINKSGERPEVTTKLLSNLLTISHPERLPNLLRRKYIKIAAYILEQHRIPSHLKEALINSELSLLKSELKYGLTNDAKRLALALNTRLFSKDWNNAVLKHLFSQVDLEAYELLEPLIKRVTSTPYPERAPIVVSFFSRLASKAFKAGKNRLAVQMIEKMLEHHSVQMESLTAASSQNTSTARIPQKTLLRFSELCLHKGKKWNLASKLFKMARPVTPPLPLLENLNKALYDSASIDQFYEWLTHFHTPELRQASWPWNENFMQKLLKEPCHSNVNKALSLLEKGWNFNSKTWQSVIEIATKDKFFHQRVARLWETSGAEALKNSPVYTSIWSTLLTQMDRPTDVFVLHALKDEMLKNAPKSVRKHLFETCISQLFRSRNSNLNSQNLTLLISLRNSLKEPNSKDLLLLRYSIQKGKASYALKLYLELISNSHQRQKVVQYFPKLLQLYANSQSNLTDQMTEAAEKTVKHSSRLPQALNCAQLLCKLPNDKAYKLAWIFFTKGIHRSKRPGKNFNQMLSQLVTKSKNSLKQQQIINDFLNDEIVLHGMIKQKLLTSFALDFINKTVAEPALTDDHEDAAIHFLIRYSQYIEDDLSIFATCLARSAYLNLKKFKRTADATSYTVNLKSLLKLILPTIKAYQSERAIPFLEVYSDIIEMHINEVSSTDPKKAIFIGSIYENLREIFLGLIKLKNKVILKKHLPLIHKLSLAKKNPDISVQTKHLSLCSILFPLLSAMEKHDITKRVLFRINYNIGELLLRSEISDKDFNELTTFGFLNIKMAIRSGSLTSQESIQAFHRFLFNYPPCDSDKFSTFLSHADTALEIIESERDHSLPLNFFSRVRLYLYTEFSDMMYYSFEDNSENIAYVLALPCHYQTEAGFYRATEIFKNNRHLLLENDLISSFSKILSEISVVPFSPNKKSHPIYNLANSLREVDNYHLNIHDNVVESLVMFFIQTAVSLTTIQQTENPNNASSSSTTLTSTSSMNTFDKEKSKPKKGTDLLHKTCISLIGAYYSKGYFSKNISGIIEFLHEIKDSLTNTDNTGNILLALVLLEQITAGKKIKESHRLLCANFVLEIYKHCKKTISDSTIYLIDKSVSRLTKNTKIFKDPEDLLNLIKK